VSLPALPTLDFNYRKVYIVGGTTDNMKINKRGRPKILSILDNKVYLDIIYEIGLGNDYPQIISKRLSKDSTNIIKQTKILIKQDFVKFQKEKRLNITRYNLTNKGLKVYNYYNQIRLIKEKCERSLI